MKFLLKVVIIDQMTIEKDSLAEAEAYARKIEENERRRRQHGEFVTVTVEPAEVKND